VNLLAFESSIKAYSVSGRLNAGRIRGRVGGGFVSGDVWSRLQFDEADYNFLQHHIADRPLSNDIMRLSIACLLLPAAALVRSQLIALPFDRTPRSGDQQPLMDPVGPAIPPSDSKESYTPPAAPPLPGSVVLSDVMGRDRSINIFAGFTRDIESVAMRLDNSNYNTTVLAPLNSAIEKLPRKPWEDPKDYNNLGSNAYEGEEGYERAQRNLRRFVEEHMVPLSPWPEKQRAKPIGDDTDIWWETRDGVKLVSDFLTRGSVLDR